MIEIDLIMSQDGQIVLWHDADPRSPLSVARRLVLLLRDVFKAHLLYGPTFSG